MQCVLFTEQGTAVLLEGEGASGELTMYFSKSSRPGNSLTGVH